MLSEKEKLEGLTYLGIKLNEVRDLDILMELVLEDARRFVNADAGSIYIKEDETLQFSYTQNDTLQQRLPKGEKLILYSPQIPQGTLDSKELRANRPAYLTRVVMM